MSLRLDMEFYESMTSELHTAFADFLLKEAQRTFKSGKDSCVMCFQNNSNYSLEDGTFAINQGSTSGNILDMFTDENFLSIISSRVSKPFSFTSFISNIGIVITFTLN